MASLGTSMEENATPQKQFYNYRIYYNAPLDISLSTQCTPNVFNGRKYFNYRVYMMIGYNDRANSIRSSICLSQEDWYRWMSILGELFAKAKSIYVDNHISETVTEDDFKLVSYKGEVLQLVPMMAKVENNLVPAVRIIFNDASRFADFPLIDIRGMYNVVSRIDIYTAGMCANLLGDSL